MLDKALMDPFELHDERLVLRPWRPDDVDAVYRACQDGELQRWTTVPSPYTRADAERWIERIAPRDWAAGIDLTWAITERPADEPIAAISLRSRPEERWAVASFGFWAAPKARGRGIVTDATRIVAKYAFTTLGVQRLEWYANVGNVASRRVAEKVGFTLEGTLRRGLDQRGTRVDAWIGSLLPGELR
jgi:RimJ/RimL family protein N-acetyltransferase